MKAKRIKGYKKEFKIYQTALKFKASYNLIVEPNFIELSLSQKINLKERLEEVIGPSFKLISSSCISSELKKQKLFNKFQLEYKNLKLFNRKCSHNKTNSKECILNQIDKTNSSKFIVLSSDLELNNELQKTCQNTPIFSIFKGILIMSSINELTKQKLLELEKKKTSVKGGELKFLEKKFDLQVDNNEVEYVPRKKKAKAPNPLSVKKKTKSVVGTNDKSDKDYSSKSKSKPNVELTEKREEIDNKLTKSDNTIENSIEEEIKQIKNEKTVDNNDQVSPSSNSKKRKRKHKSKSKSSSGKESENNIDNDEEDIEE